MNRKPALFGKIPLWPRLRLLWMGLKVRPQWVHCNGESSRASAMLAAFHHPLSITWRWAIYWELPQKKSLWRLGANCWWRDNGWSHVKLPLLGGFRFSWQPHLWSVS